MVIFGLVHDALILPWIMTGPTAMIQPSGLDILTFPLESPGDIEAAHCTVNTEMFPL